MDEAKRNAWRVEPETKLTVTILANGGRNNLKNFSIKTKTCQLAAQRKRLLPTVVVRSLEILLRSPNGALHRAKVSGGITISWEVTWSV